MRLTAVVPTECDLYSHSYSSLISSELLPVPGDTGGTEEEGGRQQVYLWQILVTQSSGIVCVCVFVAVMCVRGIGRSGQRLCKTLRKGGCI